MTTAPESVQWPARPYRPVDEKQVLSLINADRLIGQPSCTWGMLEAARAGRSPYDSAQWASLRPVYTDVVVDQYDDVVGVVSTGVRRGDDTGSILWLHAGEDRDVARTLVDVAMAHLRNGPVLGFPLATALGLGMKGVPLQRRRVTHAALREREFVDAFSLAYLHRPLGEARRPRDDRRIRLRHNPAFAGWRMQLRDAHLDMTVSADGVGWITEVQPDARHPKVTSLVEHALYLLSRHAAREVISMVPAGRPEQCDLVDLLQGLSFTEIDRLAVLRRP